MTEDDHTRAVRDAGLTGWKATVHRHPEAAGYVAVLSSPDFNPVTRAGRMIAARGREVPDAFAAALEKARGCLDRPQQQERLH